MKKVISILLSVVMVLSFASCAKNNPQKDLDAMLTALKSGDMKTLAELEGESIEDFADMQGYISIFSSVSWTFGETVMKDDDDAIVNVQITTKDMQTVFTEYISQAMQQAMQGTEMTDEYAAELLLNVIASTEQTKTFDVEVEMSYDDGKWQVDDENDAFFDAITGGLMEIVNDFS